MKKSCSLASRCQENPPPGGLQSEDAQERRTRIQRAIMNISLKSLKRKLTNEDVMKRLLYSSDPYIASPRGSWISLECIVLSSVDVLNFNIALNKNKVQIRLFYFMSFFTALLYCLVLFNTVQYKLLVVFIVSNCIGVEKLLTCKCTRRLAVELVGYLK